LPDALEHFSSRFSGQIQIQQQRVRTRDAVVQVDTFEIFQSFFAVPDHFKANRKLANLYGSLDQEHVGPIVLYNQNQRITVPGCVLPRRGE
jgi:hypothetical protein